MTRVKVCCIESLDEARLAIRLGAAALGLVSEMPSGPGVISEERIAEVAAVVPPPVATFLLTSKTDAPGIIEQQKRCGVNTLQLCDSVAPSVHEALRASLPGISIVQVIHVTGEESVDEARDVAHHVDAILLDSGNMSLAVKELGGTGRTHDWSLSAQIVREISVPVLLAGGLNAGNAREAIREVQPFGVDLCTGVRTAGALDGEKLRAFMETIAAAAS